MKGMDVSEHDDTEMIVKTLRESERKTRNYFTSTLVFYAVVLAALAVLAFTAGEAKARNAYIGFIILSYLGLNGLWISALRGLRGEKLTVGSFLSLYRLPLTGALEELEKNDKLSDPEGRLRRSEELLRRQSEAEKEHRAWPNRALSIAVITAIDLIIWLVWHNPAMAIANQVIATIISQVHISLGPKASMKAAAESRGDFA